MPWYFFISLSTYTYVVFRSQPDLSRLARDSASYDQEEEEGEAEEGGSVEAGQQENDEDFQVK